MTKLNINVEELANFIFKLNDDNNIIYIQTSSIKTKKDLFFFLFDLFCKGLILLYGKGSNRILLNELQMDQFDEIKRKLKYAHIYLNMEVYDKKTAQLLDYLPSSEVEERNIIKSSLAGILNMGDNEELSDYVFKLYMNDNLICINFDIRH